MAKNKSNNSNNTITTGRGKFRTQSMNEDCDQTNSDKIESYSSELLLSIVQNEFGYDLERNKGLQNRSGIFISFIGVIIRQTHYVRKAPRGSL